MFVANAATSIHTIPGGGTLSWLDDFLYLPEVLYTLILFWLILSGPGPCSFDALIPSTGLVGVRR
jgi:putative oxidoreductase